MPAVCDLHGLWRCPTRGMAVSGSPIARNHGNARVSRQPGLDRCGFSVWQQVDDSALFKVAQQRAVALTALPGKIVDAEDADTGLRGHRTSPHDAQQRVPADRQHQSPGKAGSRAAAQGNAEMMDDALKPRCAPCSSWRDIFGQWFAEDLSRAHGVAASEPANLNAQVHSMAVRRQVQQASLISAMDARGSQTAIRTGRVSRARMRCDQHSIGLQDDPINYQPSR